MTDIATGHFGASVLNEIKNKHEKKMSFTKGSQCNTCIHNNLLCVDALRV